MTAITHADKIAELRREIRMRESVYPRRIAEKRMTPAEADRRIAILRAILLDYEQQAATAAAMDDLFGGQR
jgi:hypothetical protein